MFSSNKEMFNYFSPVWDFIFPYYGNILYNPQLDNRLVFFL